MPSIYKPAGRKHFHTTFYVPGESGKMRKVTRSTGKTKRAEAVRAAVELEAAELAAAGAGDEKSQKILTVLAGASDDAMRGLLNGPKARDYLAEILDIATGEDLQLYSVRKWVAEWMARQEGISEATRRAYTTFTKQFIKWLGDRADTPLESLTAEDMRELRQWFLDGAGREKQVSASTASLKMKVISSIYAEAVRQGITNFNPVAPLKALPEEERISRQPFTVAEVASLVDSAPSDEWKGLILVGAFTGLRLVDCANLTWAEIDLKKGEINTMPKKTKRKRTVVRIPIHPTLREYLEHRPTPISSETKVFSNLSSYTGSGRNGLSMQFADIMKEAKVSRGKSSNHGGRTSYERSFHSLRHTLTSWLADSNVSPEVRMQIIGHKTQDMHSLYTHLGDETLRSAMSGVPTLQSSSHDS